MSLLKASDAVPLPERLRAVFTEDMKLGRDFIYHFLVTLQIPSLEWLLRSHKAIGDWSCLIDRWERSMIRVSSFEAEVFCVSVFVRALRQGASCYDLLERHLRLFCVRMVDYFFLGSQ